MKRRHVLAVLGLSYLTLGIYVLYWLYKTRKELLQFLPDKKAIPRVFLLFVPVLVLIGMVIISIAWGAMTIENYADAGQTFSVTFTVLLILGVIGIFVVSFWWFYKYFQALEAVTKGNDAMLMYGLWIGLTLVGAGPVWTLVAQSDLNKFIENDYRPIHPPYPGQPAPQPEESRQPPAEQGSHHPHPHGQPHHEHPAHHHGHPPHHTGEGNGHSPMRVQG